MFQNKKIILKYTPAARALEILCAVLITGVLFLVATMYPDAPDTVPTRYDFYGTAVQWGDSALLHPLLAVYIYVVVTGASVIARRMAPRDNPDGTLSAVLMMILCLKAIYLIYALTRTYCAMLARDLPPCSPLFLLLGLFIIILAGIFIILKRCRSNIM